MKKEDIKSIVMCAYGFGDSMIYMKALYAIKKLYPNARLSLLYRTNFKDIKLDFVDEIVSYKGIESDKEGDFYEKLKGLNCDILIIPRRSTTLHKTLDKIAKSLNIKKIISFTNLYNIFNKNFKTPFPSIIRNKHLSEFILSLVRQIDKKHFDENIKNIDFSQVKEHIYKDFSIVDSFLNSIKYDKIIGINCFSYHSQNEGVNFFIRDWIRLAQNIASTHKNFLVILMHAKFESINFNIDESENLRVFTNDESFASLVAISSKLDYFISIDTGNVHLCDILQIPSFILIRPKATRHFLGGSYNGVFDKMVVKPGFQKHYKKTFSAFAKKVEEKLSTL
ncbi:MULTISPECIES: glycosyltransferase family 9 protein [unclassified Campylobacter]|uniref:glycosyltransferase family 9 protein n=1 Tax=unclassified Campylobacter TaxID=2593542 RepID=UPI001237EA2D|nr:MULTISPECIES: hypothetical protein [unclassified Campylobacter]KAA6227258.1 hypothetical protein FMM57_04790 [Campylobacter sp. LR286c]KAA6227869.1 hypothetical protein FMM54_01690 [Campylobacter sp. LR185c]KAA6228277.1 hypothetical protein FMM55_01495 [Campylobacter sp. LR196d]KAA6231083.1 hypothetical protein FMM56_05190 [Campylobacter sp. LR264d]KAA8604443.1 hypothetical protein CGP82_02665 [Campylobacter sp. LR185c]